MRQDRIIPGVILVVIGAAFLLNNYGYINFHWSNFFFLWPIFIVIAGVNLIFAHNKTPLAVAVKIAVVVIGLGLLLFGNFGNHRGWWKNNTYTWHDNNNNNDSDDDDDDDSDSTSQRSVKKIEGNSFFTEPFNANVHVARLNISGGGTSYNLSDTTNQLFAATTKEIVGKYDFSHRNEDSVYVMDFKMNTNNVHNFNWGDDDKSNSATIKLNPIPEWEINVEAGATALDFDLSKFKVRSLKLKGGAASFDVKLGQPLATTNVVVSTGMSGVTIKIPQNAACYITSDSGLSSNNFDGFTKKGDDSYQTANFATAKNKIYIRIAGGMSDFKVQRY